MDKRKQLLIVYHSRSGNTRILAEAVIAGARDEPSAAVDVRVLDALVAGPKDVLGCDGILIGTPENFGYMSGAIKMFFETIYYPCLEHTQGLPYGLFIRAGNDGQGALTSITRIVAGLRWREVSAPLIVRGDINDESLRELRDTGMAFAAALEAGIF